MNYKEAIERIKIVQEQRAMVSAEYSRPDTQNWRKLKLQGELTLLNSELKTAKKILQEAISEKELAELKEFLRLRWPNVWDDYVNIQKAKFSK